MVKKLYRSKTNVLVAGVLSGLAEYFNQDPTMWRLGFIVLLFLTGFMPFTFVYLIFWVVVPLCPTIESVDTADYTVLKDE